MLRAAHPAGQVSLWARLSASPRTIAAGGVDEYYVIRTLHYIVMMVLDFLSTCEMHRLASARS